MLSYIYIHFSVELSSTISFNKVWQFTGELSVIVSDVIDAYFMKISTDVKIFIAMEKAVLVSLLW